jgi:hypothetical protein
VLEDLGRQQVYVDISDTFVFDSDSVYLMIRYKGKVSRFAVYNPQYQDASRYDSDDPAGKKVANDRVAASLKSLFEMMKVPPETVDEERDGKRQHESAGGAKKGSLGNGLQPK